MDGSQITEFSAPHSTASEGLGVALSGAGLDGLLAKRTNARHPKPFHGLPAYPKIGHRRLRVNRCRGFGKRRRGRGTLSHCSLAIS